MKLKFALLVMLIISSIAYSEINDYGMENIRGVVLIDGKLHNVSTTIPDKQGHLKIIYDGVTYASTGGDNHKIMSDTVDKNGLRTNIYISKLYTGFPVNFNWARGFVKASDKSNCNENSELVLIISQQPEGESNWNVGNCFQNLNSME